MKATGIANRESSINLNPVTGNLQATCNQTR
jgi:hypothetical protein